MPLMEVLWADMIQVAFGDGDLPDVECLCALTLKGHKTLYCCIGSWVVGNRANWPQAPEAATLRPVYTRFNKQFSKSEDCNRANYRYRAWLQMKPNLLLLDYGVAARLCVPHNTLRLSGDSLLAFSIVHNIAEWISSRRANNMWREILFFFARGVVNHKGTLSLVGPLGCESWIQSKSGTCWECVFSSLPINP